MAPIRVYANPAPAAEGGSARSTAGNPRVAEPEETIYGGECEGFHRLGLGLGKVDTDA